MCHEKVLIMEEGVRDSFNWSNDFLAFCKQCTVWYQTRSSGSFGAWTLELSLHWESKGMRPGYNPETYSRGQGDCLYSIEMTVKEQSYDDCGVTSDMSRAWIPLYGGSGDSHQDGGKVSIIWWLLGSIFLFWSSTRNHEKGEGWCKQIDSVTLRVWSIKTGDTVRERVSCLWLWMVGGLEVEEKRGRATNSNVMVRWWCYPLLSVHLLPPPILIWQPIGKETCSRGWYKDFLVVVMIKEKKVIESKQPNVGLSRISYTKWYLWTENPFMISLCVGLLLLWIKSILWSS